MQEHTAPTKLILVVDDDPNLLELLYQQLTFANYVVSRANTGQTAINLLKGVTPDLLILDVMLPDMDGFTVLQEMWSMGYQGPTILLTGMPYARLQAQLTRLREWESVDWVFIKPVTRTTLLRKIEELLQREEAAQQALKHRGEGWTVCKILPIPEIKEVDLAGWLGWVVLLQSETGTFGNSLVTYFPQRPDAWKVLTMDHVPGLV